MGFAVCDGAVTMAAHLGAYQLPGVCRAISTAEDAREVLEFVVAARRCPGFRRGDRDISDVETQGYDVLVAVVYRYAGQLAHAARALQTPSVGALPGQKRRRLEGASEVGAGDRENANGREPRDYPRGGRHGAR